jgi:ketosteroid isomerase-like protein
MDVERIANQFVEAINRHDVNALYRLMSVDHRFIDSGGAVYEGREAMKGGWIGYFNMVPDYRIDVAKVIVSGETAVLLGKASGTYTSDGKLRSENHWETPAAWRAEIIGGRLREWQVYADNEALRAIMQRE